jgi:hypothetical protein
MPKWSASSQTNSIFNKAKALYTLKSGFFAPTIIYQLFLQGPELGLGLETPLKIVCFTFTAVELLLSCTVL